VNGRSARRHGFFLSGADRCAALVPCLLAILLCACAGRPPTAPPAVAADAVDYGLRGHFPFEAFDDRCSYDRPMGRTEPLAQYTLLVDETGGRSTDLDCFAPGRADQPPRTGMMARYYYANAFLLLRQLGHESVSDVPGFIRASGLDGVRPTGEIYYLLAVLAGDNGLIDCAERLSLAAANGGVLQAREYWGAVQSARVSRPNEPACTDPAILSLLTAEPH
jgi:hypothetical protein